MSDSNNNSRQRGVFSSPGAKPLPARREVSARSVRERMPGIATGIVTTTPVDPALFDVVREVAEPDFAKEGDRGRFAS
ncbi:MAG: hypothetical protein R3F11_28275 [Verrucomicrobiales bacterium]